VVGLVVAIHPDVLSNRDTGSKSKYQASSANQTDRRGHFEIFFVFVLILVLISIRG